MYTYPPDDHVLYINADDKRSALMVAAMNGKDAVGKTQLYAFSYLINVNIKAQFLSLPNELRSCKTFRVRRQPEFN